MIGEGGDDKINVCPVCNSPDVSRRTRGDGWYCKENGHDFEEPKRRKPNTAGSGSPLTKRLEDMSADELLP